MRFIAQAVAAVTLSVIFTAARADVLSAARELGVRSLSLQQLDVLQDRAGGAVLLAVELDGREVVLDLAPKSYRSEKFRLVLDLGGGQQVEVEPPAPKTFRGRIAGDASSIVAGSIIDGDVTLMIVSDTGTWSVQPMPAEGPGVHAVYNERDVLEHGGVCAVADAGGPNPLALPGRPAFAMRGETEGEFRVAEIAIDADWQLFSGYFGQNQNALLNDIDSVLAGLTTIYERDVLLTFELTHVLIRTSPGANPYTTSNPELLLGQFAQEWNTNQQSVPRDVAHLWTGRNMSGSTIGIAYLGTVCTASGYGADQIRFTSNYNSRVGLFSHELGHNWNAPHCNGLGECRIMCSGLGGCSGLGNPVRFAPTSIMTINQFIATRPCVDNIGVDLPIFEDFEDQVLDPVAWLGASGFSFVFEGSAPSGFVVGRLTPGFSSLVTAPVETDAGAGSTIGVSLFLKPENSATGSFGLSVNSTSGGSQQFARIPAHDPQSGYVEYSFQLPGSVINGNTPIRFIPSSSGPTWRLDDVNIRLFSSATGTISLPFSEGFEMAGLSLDSWQPSLSEVTNAEAASGEYSLELDAGQRLESADADASDADGVVFGALVARPAAAAGDAELVVEYRNASGTWVEVERVGASALPGNAFALVEVVLPAGAEHDDLRVAFEVDGGVSNEPWRIDDVELGGEPRGTADCPADLAAPFGVLDLADIGAFTAAFLGGDPEADLAAPFGVLDLADVSAFTTSFVAGCP